MDDKKKKKKKSLPIKDLRAIIHGLRMSGFAFVHDEETKDKISYMIEGLPSAEDLDSLIETPEVLRDVEEMVGEIMKLVDQGGKRNQGFKARFEAKKNLSPRYKVMGGRIMNKELTSSLIKMSAFADSRNEPVVAENAIALAKKSSIGDITEDEIKTLIADCNIAGLHAEVDSFLKEAGMWSGIADVAKGVGQGIGKGVQQGIQTVKNVGQQIGQGVKNVGQGVKDTYQLGNMRGTFERINKEVADAIGYATQSYASMQDPSKKKKAGDVLTMLQNMQTVGSQVYDIVMADPVDSSVASPSDGGGIGGAPAATTPVAPAGSSSVLDNDILGGGGGAGEPAVTGVPSAAPGVPAQKDIWQGVDRNKMLNIINKSIPEVWESGYKGKAVAQLTDEELKQAISDNVGAKSLPTFLQSAKKRLMLNKLSQNKKWIRVA